MEDFDFILWPAMALPAVALAIGVVSGVGKKPWLHWRLFGAMVLVLQGPSLVNQGLGLGTLRPPSYVSAFWVVFGVVALFFPGEGDQRGRRWRTFGAVLLSLTALAGLCVVCLSVILIASGPEVAGLGLLLAMLQSVTVFRMGADAFHCLREGSPPMPRPRRSERGVLRFVASIVCRTSTVVVWGVPAGFFAICALVGGCTVGSPAIFGFALVPAVLAGVLWSTTSIIRELRAPRPELQDATPAVF